MTPGGYRNGPSIESRRAGGVWVCTIAIVRCRFRLRLTKTHKGALLNFVGQLFDLFPLLLRDTERNRAASSCDIDADRFVLAQTEQSFTQENDYRNTTFTGFFYEQRADGLLAIEPTFLNDWSQMAFDRIDAAIECRGE